MNKNEKIIEVTDSMDKPALYVFESGIYKLSEKYFNVKFGKFKSPDGIWINGFEIISKR